MPRQIVVTIKKVILVIILFLKAKSFMIFVLLMVGCVIDDNDDLLFSKNY